jgi:DNA polymerase
MPVLFLDYETYYDDEYSLRKMTPAEYILDHRFECIGVAAAVDDGPSQWIDGPQVGEFLQQFDPAETTLVTFNALFDACITHWRFNFLPARLVCTMRMAVALHGQALDGNCSLASVLKYLKLGEKGDAIIHAKGKHGYDLRNDPVLWREYQAYAINDNDKNRLIFDTLNPEFPASERRVMDRVLRAAVEPHFIVDTDMLRAHLDEIDTAQMQSLIDAGAPTSLDAPDRDEKLEEFAKTLRSAPQFEARLKALGVDVEYKPSLTDPGRQIPAFAKTDEFMANLLDSDDPALAALAHARLGLRSTIEKSRGERIMSIGTLNWPEWVSGNMPIPLRYSGAHTHRLSGDWKINMQNLPAGRGGNKSKLRKAIKAPPGYKVLVGDLSQIECRITAWLVKQLDLMKVFAEGKDPYSILASDVFGFPVDKNVHKLERFIGKSGVLGLGFRCGAAKFYNMVLRSARGMQMDMTQLLAIWTEGLAQRTVETYRTKNSAIMGSWYHLDFLLKTAWSGQSAPVRWGGTQPLGCVEIGYGYVLLPNGMKMVYDVMAPDENGDLRYRYGKRAHLIHGGKFLENIVQALARVVIMHAALRLWDRGLKFRLQAHDELVFIVPERDAAECKALLLEELRRRPSWAPDLPLDAEASFGDTYGDAK